MLYTSTRTQIILPTNLRQAIDRQRSRTSETLGEFLRQAAQDRLAKESQKQAHLAQLAEEVIGSLERGSWAKTNMSSWQKKMRADRGAT